jgi:hypothetical protein
LTKYRTLLPEKPLASGFFANCGTNRRQNWRISPRPRSDWGALSEMICVPQSAFLREP